MEPLTLLLAAREARKPYAGGDLLNGRAWAKIPSGIRVCSFTTPERSLSSGADIVHSPGEDHL
jgi:hypothetical protein